MESTITDWYELDAVTRERPSTDFIRAVAKLLETDPSDILTEMGYVPAEAVTGAAEVAAV